MQHLILLVQLTSMVALLLECIYILPRIRSNQQAILFFAAAANLINSAGYYFELTAKSEETYIAALKMSYLGRIWVSFALFILAIKASNIAYSKLITCALSAIHIFTYALIFTFEHHNLYYTTGIYSRAAGLAHIKFGHGPWYQFYNYLLLPSYIIIGLLCLITSVYKERDLLKRKQLIALTASIAVESLYFGLEIVKLVDGYDLTMVGHAMGSVIICIGLYKYNILGTMDIVREYVVEDIPEAVIAIDLFGKLEYANRMAKDNFKLFENLPHTIKMFDDAIEESGSIKVGDATYSIEKKTIVHEGYERGTVYVLEDDTELYESNKALKKQKEIAENANKSKSAFLSVVSHEIRTPMNAVVGMTDILLREGELNEKQEKYLKNIKNSGAALVMIVNDILDQSKIEAGKMELVEDDYEIRPMVEDVMMIIENRIENKPVKLITNIDASVPKCLVGDSLRVRQILINLMNNAVKFTEEGSIELSISATDVAADTKSVHFSIKDSGQGIRPEDLKKLGEAFSQVDTKKNHSKEGTGLGLSISKNFINLMGGQLRVDSKYGEGSTFSFAINQKTSSGVNIDDTTKVTKQAWQESVDFTCPNARILVIDDNDMNLMVAEAMMEPLEAHIDLAESGQEALALVKANEYDIILVDYMMPYMDGVETTSNMRAMGIMAPIIALTGDGAESTKEKFNAAGINGFMEKPINLLEIKKQLLKYLPQELIKA